MLADIEKSKILFQKFKQEYLLEKMDSEVQNQKDFTNQYEVILYIILFLYHIHAYSKMLIIHILSNQTMDLLT